MTTLLILLVKKIMQTRVPIVPLIGLNQIQVKIIHINSKAPQNGLNEPVKGQSVVTHPATTSVINNSKSDAKQLPQINEADGFNYTALSLLLGLDVALVAVGAEKKRKKY